MGVGTGMRVDYLGAVGVVADGKVEIIVGALLVGTDTLSFLGNLSGFEKCRQGTPHQIIILS